MIADFEASPIIKQGDIIPNITVEIYISACEPDRVCTQPTPDKSIIPAVDVVLEVRGNVERFTGVAEKERVHTGNQVAKGVVDQVCSSGGGKDVADRAEVVG